MSELRRGVRERSILPLFLIRPNDFTLILAQLLTHLLFQRSQYTDANRRFAYYNNLKSGTYRFCLKATNENGIWSQEIRELEVVVLPPF